MRLVFNSARGAFASVNVWYYAKKDATEASHRMSV